MYRQRDSSIRHTQLRKGKRSRKFRYGNEGCKIDGGDISIVFFLRFSVLAAAADPIQLATALSLSPTRR